MNHNEKKNENKIPAWSIHLILPLSFPYFSPSFIIRPHRLKSSGMSPDMALAPFASALYRRRGRRQYFEFFYKTSRRQFSLPPDRRGVMRRDASRALRQH